MLLSDGKVAVRDVIESNNGGARSGGMRFCLTRRRPLSIMNVSRLGIVF